jgi:acetyl-CoA carboxylase biotin carboxyl carrier protein
LEDVTKEGRGLIGDLEIRQIVQLIEALDRSGLDSLRIDLGHLRLTLGKGVAAIEPSSPLQGESASSVAPAPSSVTAKAAALPPAPGQTRSAAAKPPARGTVGTVDVRAPIMGLFYSKPDPGSPPFVSLGSEVQEGTTVGLIEVMKVFNAVQAGAKGVIAELCVKDAETVAIGQTLFRIRPAAI